MPFILYRSSAGSGKTFTLVKEYLKIVLRQPEEFRHILAITFTNKAAQEMKERILRYLRELSDPEFIANNANLPLLEAIQSETGLERDIIVKRAAVVLQMILHQYSDFSVTTIDSFMHSVIRTFAHDLHLPVDFEVDLDNEVLVATAVNNLIREVGKNEELTKALIDLVLYKSEDEKDWNIEYDLVAIGNQLFKESGQLATETFQQQPIDLERSREIFRHIRKLRKEFGSRLKDLGSKGVSVILGKNIPFSAFYQGEKGLPKYFRYLEEGRFDKITPTSYVKKTIEEDQWYSQSTAYNFKTEIDSIKEELKAVYLTIEEIRIKEYPDYISLGILEKNILPLAVLHLIDKELQIIKSENNILPIGEFNKRIADTVLDEPVPFIYERLGEWYHYYLLDEFQDTSVLQWLNLLPLVENSLAGNYTCILVGDGKQAIYRWRNGDVEQFARLPEVYLPMKQDIPEGRKLILARQYQEYQLERNFRTAPEIVKFNNEFFTILTSFLDTEHQRIYKEVIQQPKDKAEGGYVSIEFFSRTDEDVSFNDAQLPRVLEIIRQCRADGFNWKDIAVLCRSNANASLVSRYLMNEGINVSSSESILLKNSPKVNVLLACLGLINNPSNQVNLEVLSRYQLDHDRPEQGTAFIFDPKYRGKPVYELTEEIVRVLAMDQMPDPFIIFFLDAVLQFSQRQDTSVSGFLDWWTDNADKATLKTPEDYDAVKVLTIHKAKGLEFNIVIYPFADERRKVTGNLVWVDFKSPGLPELRTALVPMSKSLLDSSLASVYEEEDNKVRLDFLNVLYVAMTRPKERLYVLTGKPGKDYSNGNKTSDLFGIYLEATGHDPFQTSRIVRGSENKRPEAASTSYPGFIFQTIHSSDWTERMSIRQNHPADWDVLTPDKPRSLGNLVHQVLAGIQTFEDTDVVIQQHIIDGYFDQKMLNEARNYLYKMQSDSSLAPFFNPLAEIRTEAEILTPAGRSYRPDRLVIYPDKALILDYKTGSPHESHGKQLLQYARLLKDMGYSNIQSYLYYLENQAGLQQVS